MIALLGLFDLFEIGVELVLLGKRSAIDAREHFAVRIAAPIGAGDFHQLERIADLAGRGHMRAAAQIEPVALLVDFDLLIFRDGVDQLDLEQLALVAEHLLRLVARPRFLGERFVARDDLAHLLFDGREILRRERLVAEEVVIEAVVDHRADGDLRAGPQRLHRFGEHVRGVVANAARARADPRGSEIRSWRRVRSGRRDPPLCRRAPSPPCAWQATAKCPWRCRGRWCCLDTPDARRRERSRRPWFTPVAHSLPTGCSVSEAPRINRLVLRASIYGRARFMAIVGEKRVLYDPLVKPLWTGPVEPYSPPPQSPASRARGKRMRIVVRQGTRDDAELVSALNADVQAVHAAKLPERFKPPGPSSFPAEETGALLTKADNIVLLAFVDGDPAGYVYAEIFRRPETSLTYAYEMISCSSH